jgi:hypothetical protein
MEQAVSFGRYRFDPPTRRLWPGKREVRLTPKAASVLAVLVARAGRPVNREELFASVWADTVVGDDALTSCVQELREALADDAKQPRFIETRHRRGVWRPGVPEVGETRPVDPHTMTPEPAHPRGSPLNKASRALRRDESGGRSENPLEPPRCRAAQSGYPQDPGSRTWPAGGGSSDGLPRAARSGRRELTAAVLS